MKKFMALFGWILVIGSLVLFAIDWLPVGLFSVPLTSMSETNEYVRLVSGDDTGLNTWTAVKLPALFTGLLMIGFVWYLRRSG